MNPLDTTTAYEFRRNKHGYGVFELRMFKGKVYEEKKIIEYDFLAIALNKLAAYIHAYAPDHLKPSNPEKDEALTAKAKSTVANDSKDTETK